MNVIRLLSGETSMSFLRWNNERLLYLLICEPIYHHKNVHPFQEIQYDILLSTINDISYSCQVPFSDSTAAHLPCSYQQCRCTSLILSRCCTLDCALIGRLKQRASHGHQRQTPDPFPEGVLGLPYD